MAAFLMTVLTAALPLLAMMVGIIVVTRALFGGLARLDGYSYRNELVVRDNPAVGIRLGSLLLAVIISFFGVVHSSGVSVVEDLNLITKYALLVLVGLFFSLRFNDYFILSRFDNNKEVVGEQNTAVAIVEGSTYIATALIFSGALHGALVGMNGGFLVSLGWFVIGQALLFALARLIYRPFVRVRSERRAAHTMDTTMDTELDGHNNACALDLGAFLLSGGLALGAAVRGEFNGWLVDLPRVGLFMLVWLVFMVITQAVVNYIIVPGQRARYEIMVERNWGVGFVSGVLRVAITMIYTWYLG